VSEHVRPSCKPYSTVDPRPLCPTRLPRLLVLPSDESLALTVVVTTTTTARLKLPSHCFFSKYLCVVACGFSLVRLFFGEQEERRSTNRKSIDNEFLNDDDDPTLVDDRGRRCSGPRLDRPVLRHDDALRCRTTTSTFFAVSLLSSSNNGRNKEAAPYATNIISPSCSTNVPLISFLYTIGMVSCA
jgi:hypothetical protein